MNSHEVVGIFLFADGRGSVLRELGKGDERTVFSTRKEGEWPAENPWYEYYADAG
jgi:hypothetical protein